jgi:hypothetical protein
MLSRFCIVTISTNMPAKYHGHAIAGHGKSRHDKFVAVLLLSGSHHQTSTAAFCGAAGALDKPSNNGVDK